MENSPYQVLWFTTMNRFLDLGSWTAFTQSSVMFVEMKLALG